MSEQELLDKVASDVQQLIKVKNIATPSSVQKRLGAFYTPENLSKILTDWAIRDCSNSVLEPSFGGCGFLEAARRRLSELGCTSPREQIFGCDIDEKAFKFLEDVLGQPVDIAQFRLQDFLQIHAGREWANLFDVTIGNPPYIPYQAIPEASRQEYSKRWEELGENIGKRASLWAHFLVHAVSFVAPRGRMAWVLPGAFLQADYAVEVRGFLAKKFSQVLCVLMHQRFFKDVGTEEETVLLLAEGRRDMVSQGEILFVEASSLPDLSKIIHRWESGEKVGQIFNARPSYLAVESDAIAAYEKIRERNDCHPLGNILKTSIGLVTGANSFFVLNKEKLEEHSISINDTVPLLPKMTAAPGIFFSDDDYRSYVANGGRGYLIHRETFPDEGTSLRGYFERFSDAQRSGISTFKKRSIWHAPDDRKIPDAFFSVMNHNGPKIVLNKASVNCTNTIHRVFFNKDISDKLKKLTVISIFTSFSQLSSEFVGRRYGSGVLKHEPREAEKIEVLLPEWIGETEIDMAFGQLDSLLRNEKIDDAYDFADGFIFDKLKSGKELASAFRNALIKVRKLRKDARSNV